LARSDITTETDAIWHLRTILNAGPTDIAIAFENLETTPTFTVTRAKGALLPIIAAIRGAGAFALHVTLIIGRTIIAVIARSRLSTKRTLLFANILLNTGRITCITRRLFAHVPLRWIGGLRRPRTP